MYTDIDILLNTFCVGQERQTAINNLIQNNQIPLKHEMVDQIFTNIRLAVIKTNNLFNFKAMSFLLNTLLINYKEFFIAILYALKNNYNVSNLQNLVLWDLNNQKYYLNDSDLLAYSEILSHCYYDVNQLPLNPQQKSIILNKNINQI